ncbi:3-hydroxyacyl-CoA dehydrogenase family protein [Calderihabitans maritimus]|uniref:3-hydroxyacyl-CoA dehydrogenase family protein n=1 Tax=Calderihabitans maritimus TaxID=1246530 RepID=UPI000B503CB0
MKTIAVLGAGLMGSGIAQVAAQNGFQVHLVDLTFELIEKGLHRARRSLQRLEKAGKIPAGSTETVLSRIQGFIDLEAAAEDADLVIEAVPENLELKKNIFRRLDVVCRPEVILATNTSELSITAIGAATQRPDKVIGMHWFNPPPVMRLIEIVIGRNTSPETVATIEDISQRLGKETVRVKDAQGFVTSRVLAAHMIECMRVLEEGVASIEDIDKAVKLGLNYPMGPFELADYVGLDTMLFVAENLTEAYGDRFRPPQVLRKLVEAGHLGVKSGKGFYDYTKN